MPQLYLLRHAKSDWGSPAASDHERPLAPRGRKAAPRMGAEMKRRGWIPGLVVCSTARRARETLDLVFESLGAEIETRFDRRVYDADATDLVEIARELADRTGDLLIVGHNPAMQSAAARLARGGDEAALMRLERKFPTGGLAVFEFDGADWSTDGLAAGRLAAFVTPRELD